MGITIQHFELHFDVEANEEEAAFARMFDKYFNRYARVQREQHEADEGSECDRALGDREEA